MTLAPEDVDGGVEEEFEDARGNDTANHRSGDAFHDIGAALVGWGPHDGEQAEEDGANGHDFGANALDGAFNDSGLEVVHGVHATGGAEFVPGVVQVEEHDNAGFGVQASECDEADPDGHAHVVTQYIEKPE